MRTKKYRFFDSSFEVYKNFPLLSEKTEKKEKVREPRTPDAQEVPLFTDTTGDAKSLFHRCQ